MKFKKITFNNYRCFMNGTISFDEIDDKNINLLIAPNGGGKTETLFAFWWTFYDFDFSTLRAKENTPYALNSELYRKLEKGKEGLIQKCSVEIEFQSDNVDYIITKTCEFRKPGKRIVQDEYQILRYYNEKHELSLPIREREEIEKILNKVLPKSILYGIIFDGERMQKLSATDEQSKKAIKGVISDITNVELIERIITYYSSIKRQFDSELKKCSNKSGNETLSEIVKSLEEKEKELEKCKEKLKEYQENKDVDNERLNTISEELKKIENIKDIEKERENYKKSQTDSERDLDSFYKSLSDTLIDAYLIISDKLLDDVDDIIQKIDVPQDLTVQAVRSILSRDNCICGRYLDKDAKEKLEELILSLPPDNINSTLAEVIRNLRDRSNDVKTQLKTHYGYITECEKKIKKYKDLYAKKTTEISELTDGLSDEDRKNVKELEEERTKIIGNLAIYKKEIPELTKKQNDLEREIKSLKEKRNIKSQSKDDSKALSGQISFVEKCLTALEHIKDINKNKALHEINIKLENAYSMLSEDSDLGKNIRIIQYDNTKRYQIVVYFKKNQIDLINTWKKNGEYNRLIDSGKSDDEIEEMTILECIDSNSTGQSKMNTFSFVKAILDYSNSNKSDDVLASIKHYPLLIDAPFSDISGDNLIRSSSLLYTFTDQIILMIDYNKFEMLKNYLGNHISNIYEFIKNENMNSTTIKKVREVQ